MSVSVLDRPVWNMLCGPQADLNVGADQAVRINPGFGPFAAAVDRSPDAQRALVGLLHEADDVIWLIEPEPWPVPPGSQLLRTATLVQMVATEPQPVQPGDAVPRLLGELDAAAMTALAKATQPGPWGDLTRTYGDFYGLDRNAKLAGMAGERMRPSADYCEVSGVCTWPEYRGQGLAAQLIRRVMAGFAARGQVPFLHSYAANATAIELYESLGFAVRREMVVTMLARA